MRRIRAVVFDLDGTLTLPGAIDFARMRSRIQCPPDTDILTWVSSFTESDPRRREQLEEIIREEEDLGLKAARPMPDAEALFKWLKAQDPPLKIGLLTRNNTRVMDQTLKLFSTDPFDIKLSRDWTGGPPKPSPAAILHMGEVWGLKGEEIVMVGDSDDDVMSGRGAGCALSICIGDYKKAVDLCDKQIKCLSELMPLLLS